MPAYDFRCIACGLVFEEYSRYDEEKEIVIAVSCECGSLAERVWITPPGVASDGNLTAIERTAALMKFGKDPSSRAELSRMKARGGDLPVGTAEMQADRESKKKDTKFRLTDDQKREAVQMIRRNRAQGKDDAWRMQYTQDKQVIKAGEQAAKELANGTK